MSKPTILHVIGSLTIGGAEVLLKDTVNSLPQYKHVIVYLNEPSTLKNSFVHSDVNFKCLHHKKWLDLIRTVIRLNRIIKKAKPILVHAHLLNPTFITRLAIPVRVKFFFTLHNIMSKDAFEVNKLSLVAEKLTYSKRHNLIAVSQAVLKDYDQWVGVKGKAFVLYNYVHNKYFDLQYNYSKEITDGLKLVAVGHLRKQKNYLALLDAFSLIKDYPVSLDIYGSGDLKAQLENRIKSEGLNIRLMGRVNDVSTVLNEYHAYIMPSLFEGFGIAPMEAMAAGMPVLLSQIDVFKELSKDIPVYFDPTNPNSIADAIKTTIYEWQMIKERAKKSKAMIYEKASMEIYLRNLLTIYDEMPI